METQTSYLQKLEPGDEIELELGRLSPDWLIWVRSEAMEGESLNRRGGKEESFEFAGRGVQLPRRAVWATQPIPIANVRVEHFSEASESSNPAISGELIYLLLWDLLRQRVHVRRLLSTSLRLNRCLHSGLQLRDSTSQAQASKNSEPSLRNRVQLVLRLAWLLYPPL